MITQLKYVTVIVKDYDEALSWYTQSLGLEKRMDRSNGEMRWLTVGIPGQTSPEIILQKPNTTDHDPENFKKKLGQIGNGTTWVLYVDDCHRTIDELRARGVKILEEPEKSPWGVSALIADLYGNLFSLIQLLS